MVGNREYITAMATASSAVTMGSFKVDMEVEKDWLSLMSRQRCSLLPFYLFVTLHYLGNQEDYPA